MSKKGGQDEEIDKINRAVKLGGLAYLIELEIRLFAHRTKELEKFTHESSPALEEKFFAYLGEKISEGQKNKISECRDFRNKLLHSDWWKICSDEDYKKAFAEVIEVVNLVRSHTGLKEMKMSKSDPSEIDWTSFDFAEKYIFNTYRDVAIASTGYEIVMRNLAHQLPESQAIAYDEKITLEEIQNKLADGLGFAPETRDLLENCRKARNKILHCDFYAAKTFASKIAPAKVANSGKVIVLRGDQDWKAELVSESTRRGAGVFGWALEGLSSGAADATYDALMVISQKIYFKDFKKDKSPS